MSQDRKKIIEAVNKISYGLYVISSVAKDGRINGQIGNTVFQITSTPMRVAVGINKSNYTYELIKESGVFAINVLQQNQLELVTLFGLKSGREINKFENVKYHKTAAGVPVLDDILSWMECRVVSELTVDCGTHALFVADVVDGDVLTSDEPLTYKLYRDSKIKKNV
ncbi:MAG: flavin reductase family protein [Elusimicrobiota bacterium]|nr:flavin reductase family protein [Elusimicrobiota bacterium]